MNVINARRLQLRKQQLRKDIKTNDKKTVKLRVENKRLLQLADRTQPIKLTQPKFSVQLTRSSARLHQVRGNHSFHRANFNLDKIQNNSTNDINLRQVNKVSTQSIRVYATDIIVTAEKNKITGQIGNIRLNAIQSNINVNAQNSLEKAAEESFKVTAIEQSKVNLNRLEKFYSNLNRI